MPSALSAAWPPAAQWATAFILGVATTLLAVHVFNSTSASTRPTEIIERRVLVQPDGQTREVAGVEEPPAKATPNRKGMSKKEAALKGTIDVNRASLNDLQKLPGIGPKLSQRIVDEREKRPFKSKDDLRRVSGIGPKTLERLSPYITTGGAEIAAAKE
jgi:competence ComEA-like helix-hairpin-helix protein